VSGPRGCIAVFGAALILLGIVGFVMGAAHAPGFPAIPVLIFGCLVLVTVLVEPVYGKLVPRPPLSGGLRPTSEKFIDPASGKPVEVWFDPATGERRYVDVEGEKKR
jgi:hypothetical protein